MGLFTKKYLNSEEYDKLSKDLTQLFNIVTRLSTELDALKTNQNSLRGMINRKFNPKGLEEEKEGNEEEENIKGMKFY